MTEREPIIIEGKDNIRRFQIHSQIKLVELEMKTGMKWSKPSAKSRIAKFYGLSPRASYDVVLAKLQEEYNAIG